MYRIKNLSYKEIYNDKGKKFGEVKDVGIDYYERKIKGFFIPKNIFNKKNFVNIEDILSFGDRIIAKRKKCEKVVAFEEIRGLDIIDLNNNMIGVVEDIIIDYNFNIIAIITSEGLLNKFKIGKKLILMKETILGDENILYLGNSSIKVYSSPHKILEALI